MKIRCTFPGRHGDLLWALPTVRLISETYDTKVDLQIGREYAGIVPLLQLQPYLGEVWADPLWPGDRAVLEEGGQPPHELGGYDRTYHLGYPRWPTRPLPFETYDRISAGWTVPESELLRRPWITVPPLAEQEAYPLAIGFTTEWFELKVGLIEILGHTWARAQAINGYMLVAPGSRWTTEQPYVARDWVLAAQQLQAAKVFLGDCSALHVLAVALGTPVVAMEPNPDRWNPIFWPLGTTGPAVTLVRGTDGKPTFDARHVKDALIEALR